MTNAEKAKLKLQLLRLWADHLGLRLRRRGTGFSIYGNGARVVFRKLSQIKQWLDKWMQDELARLS